MVISGGRCSGGWGKSSTFMRPRVAGGQALVYADGDSTVVHHPAAAAARDQTFPPPNRTNMPPEITVANICPLFRVKVRNQRYAVRVGVWG